MEKNVTRGGREVKGSREREKGKERGKKEGKEREWRRMERGGIGKRGENEGKKTLRVKRVERKSAFVHSFPLQSGMFSFEGE